jgi:hypothetical protein
VGKNGALHPSTGGGELCGSTLLAGGRNRVITMAADVFFVDGTTFLVTLSRNISFVMAENLPVRTAKALVKQWNDY